MASVISIQIRAHKLKPHCTGSAISLCIKVSEETRKKFQTYHIRNLCLLTLFDQALNEFINQIIEPKQKSSSKTKDKDKHKLPKTHPGSLRENHRTFRSTNTMNRIFFDTQKCSRGWSFCSVCNHPLFRQQQLRMLNISFELLSKEQINETTMSLVHHSLATMSRPRKPSKHLPPATTIHCVKRRTKNAIKTPTTFVTVCMVC
jgi:hypothetical protein